MGWFVTVLSSGILPFSAGLHTLQCFHKPSRDLYILLHWLHIWFATRSSVFSVNKFTCFVNVSCFRVEQCRPNADLSPVKKSQTSHEYFFLFFSVFFVNIFLNIHRSLFYFHKNLCSGKKRAKNTFRCIMQQIHFFSKLHRYFSFLDIFLDKKNVHF